MKLLFVLTIASSIALLNAAATSRHEGRKWSKPLVVAEELPSEQPELATELQAPSQDSINYYIRPNVQEPYEITYSDDQESPKKYSKEQDSYSRPPNGTPGKDQPVQFQLSTRLNFTSPDEVRKAQVFPTPKYGNIPKKFLGFKNKPHYLKFYADEAVPKSNTKGTTQQKFFDNSPQSEYSPHNQPKEIVQRLSKHIIEQKTEKKILPRQQLPIFDSETEAVVPRLSYIKPTSEDHSSEEDEEEEQEKIVEEVKPVKSKSKAKAKLVKPKLGALTDGKHRVEFQMHGHDGPQSYKFGYDTGKGSSRQFRFEERDNEGLVRGHYGFFDDDGKMHVIKYRASADDGFRTDE